MVKSYVCPFPLPVTRYLGHESTDCLTPVYNYTCSQLLKFETYYNENRGEQNKSLDSCIQITKFQYVILKYWKPIQVIFVICFG